MKTGLYIFILLIVTSLIGISCSDSVVPTDVNDEMDILEESVRFQIQEENFAVMESPKFYVALCGDSTYIREGHTYVLFKDSKDFSKEFLQRFSDIKPPVKNYSDFISRDKSESSVLFRNSHVRFLDDNHAKMYGGYYAGFVSASWEVFYFTKINSKWVIQTDSLLQISKIR